MIYLVNTTDAQVAYIPRDTEFTGTLSLSLKSTVDLDTPYISATVVDLNVFRTVYAVAVELPEDIQPGEYQYKLTAGGVEVSTGVLVIGEYTQAREQYNKQITYEQYNG